MKKNLKIGIISAVALFVVITTGIILVIHFGLIPGKPYYLTDTKPSEVESVSIFDGSSGAKAVISDPDDLEKIINNFNEVKIRRGRKLPDIEGFSYSTTVNFKDGSSVNYTIGGQSLKSNGYEYEILEGEIEYDLLSTYVDEAILNKNIGQEDSFVSVYILDSIVAIGITDAESNKQTIIKDSDDIKKIVESLDPLTLICKERNNDKTFEYKYILSIEHVGATDVYYINGETDIKSEDYIYQIDAGTIDIELLKSFIENNTASAE